MTPQRERLVELLVEDGEKVKKDQLLALFDTRILLTQLELLRTSAGFRGAINSARALVELRKSKLATLENLAASGNAPPQELETARTNLTIAEAQLQQVLEDIRYKEAEQQVVLAQIEEKKLFCPFDSVVAKIYKHEGDLVGGTTPEPIMTLVQLNPLVAEFHLTPPHADRLHEGMSVTLDQAGEMISGTITFVSPVIEAQSGTVLVKVELANPDGSLVSGSRVGFTPPQM